MNNMVGKRLDIQGLRALCVASVILYHLEIGFNSGYLGVDLFFVISGYVISNLLSGKLNGDKREELLRFYKGRIFRLVPALGTVVLTTSILSFLLISPLGMQQNASKTGIGALLFSSNFVAAEVTEDYFALPAQSNPLLHTWSLGVEEQFYLIFPVVLFIVFASIQKRIRIRWLIGFGFFLCSMFTYLELWGFRLSIGSVSLDGFYSPLSRAWQFLLGGFAYAIVRTRTNHTQRISKSFLSWIALISILACLNLPESTFHFSSPFSLIPTFLLFFLLSYGEGRFSIYAKLIRSRFLTWLGDRSYSLYLWHWPFIVFGTYLFPQNKMFQIGALSLGLILSLLAFKFIERPFHNMPIRNNKNTAMIIFLFLIFPLLTAGTLGFVSSQFLFPRYESGRIQGNFIGDVGAINFERFAATSQSKCADSRTTAKFEVADCPIDVLIIGDSHAEHLVPGFNKIFPELITTSASNAVFSNVRSNSYQGEFRQIVEHPTLKVVIFNSYWAKNGIPADLDRAVQILLQNGKSVLLLDDIPNFPFDAFSCKYGLSIFVNISRCSTSSTFFFDQQKSYMPDLKRIVSFNENLELLNTSNYFCDLEICSMVIDKEIMYLDMNHLNVNGSIYITKKLFEDSLLLCQKFSVKLSKSCA